MKAFDAVGREIKSDDYIVYAAIDCDSAVLRFGQVKSIVPVPAFGGVKIKIKAKAAYRGYNWETKESDVWTRQKDVTLAFPSRISVIDNPPSELRAILQ